MSTNQKFIDMMVNQPNTALFRKYTSLGISLLDLYHMDIGEKETSYKRAMQKLMDLRRNKNALRAAGIVFDPEQEKELEQEIAELKTNLVQFYILVTVFGHVQSLPQPGLIELTSFKESLENLDIFNTKGTPWEDEDDLVHVFPKSSEPLDRLMAPKKSQPEDDTS
ncbi:hypothetical protein PISL3812_07849 [Talaromyces islandicus]|uniref:Uncharacterized protein n=1 Tax=Talaromyces islandicus TaxID=28573 RepID=A0A0U1M5G4_TALIS|nr:hypothetical protein PISL3812_07849 [Talaromyces islandicus]